MTVTGIIWGSPIKTEANRIGLESEEGEHDYETPNTLCISIA
jgi:hypothetical protein